MSGARCRVCDTEHEVIPYKILIVPFEKHLIETDPRVRKKINRLVLELEKLIKNSDMCLAYVCGACGNQIVGLAEGIADLGEHRYWIDKVKKGRYLKCLRLQKQRRMMGMKAYGTKRGKLMTREEREAE